MARLLVANDAGLPLVDIEYDDSTVRTDPFWVPTCRVPGCDWDGDRHASRNSADVVDWAFVHVGQQHP